MFRRTLLIALVFAASCKKESPKGDLPPVGDWGSAKPAAPAAPTTTAPPPNPHAGLGSGNLQGSVPAPTPPRTPDKLPDGSLAMGTFSLTAPADWTVKPTTSSMRAAQFQLPAKPGAEAELVVTHFGAHGAGTVEDNVDRWLRQFEQPGGKPSRDAAKIEKTKFGGQDATVIAVSGHYVAPAMPGGSETVDKQDQALLAAIVESPSGPYYFKLVGAKSTVDANTAAFRAMLGSLKVR